MEIAKNFGLDPVLLGAQIVNFLIVFYLLRRFLYKPILDVLHKRQKLIKEGVKKAEEANIMFEKAVQKEKDTIRHAQDEARKLLADARKQQIEQAKLAEDMAKNKVETLLADARAQIAFESKEAEKRLSAQLSGLALLFLQKSLTGLLGKKEQEEVINRVTAKMKRKTN